MWSCREEACTFSLGEIPGGKAVSSAESSRRSREKETRRNEKPYRNTHKKVEEWSSTAERIGCWWSTCCCKGNIYVAKYHLGKVKPERVGQRSPPSQYVTFGAALRVLQALLFSRLLLPSQCCFACWSQRITFAFHCLLIIWDHSCCLLQFLAPSPPSLMGGGGEQGLGICQVSIFLGKYLHWVFLSVCRCRLVAASGWFPFPGLPWIPPHCRLHLAPH